MDRKIHQFARAIISGIFMAIYESLITYAGVLIQKIGAYSVGVEHLWYGGARSMYAYNHLYYTLGLVFFLGMNLTGYWVFFDKKIKKSLSQSMINLIPISVFGAVAVFAVWLISTGSVVRLNNMRTYVSISSYGPKAMVYLTINGWALFAGLLIASGLVKNTVLVLVEKNKEKASGNN